ncbi:ThuA domain-containing protein [Saccharopolyspora hordei]|uniref:Trehalose utilization protein n=1 Tax=Saccharopolyspora hordei TaxID=1838 RepID=A0A853AP16_9PSEU|nr:ThuA domain-containing protein [Saccharopolyspora hordei]NYI84133.1 trehalose utilization protein [Saccharopolyspora hordei]
MSQLRITVWNEGVHESTKDPAGMAEYYPEGIHGALAAGIREQLPDSTVRTALLSDPEHGLPEEVLADTDVLLWWGHKAHGQVDDAVVDRVQRHVLGGMGLLVLHSGHFSKVFTRLLGTTCSLSWRNAAERELVWTVDPTHPIAEGIPNPLVIPEQETYGEFFDIPAPDELVFISSFSGGEVFRSGVTFRRGKGRIFYFSPGDERYPVYNQPEIKRVLANGIRWAARPEVDRSIPEVSNPPRDWFLES